jgi:hypothetical protein
MKKSEAKWNTLLNQYLREKKMYCFYELKQTDDNTFSFSKIEPHQWTGLQATKKNGLVWKLSDEDQRQKPCDGFSAPPLPSYLVIKFKSGFYMIDILDLVELEKQGRYNISERESRELAYRVIKLNLKK